MKKPVETEKTFSSLADFADMDTEAVARAVEADAGVAVPCIRDALKQLKRGEVGRVTTPEQLLIRKVRQATGLSQEAFSACIGTPLATLRGGGEQGRFQPPGAVICLMQLLDKRPELIAELEPA